MMAIVSKMFCSSSKVVLTVRKRPHVVSGGGFVVENAASDSSSEVVFRADGCGILGKKGELILRDSKNLPLLLIYQQVQTKKEVELMTNKDMYNVVVNPGIDQAFVIGVIAVLDYIYHESTSC